MAPSSPAWTPQVGPQTDAITADWCPELLFGGAAGGGKSDYLLGDFLQDVPVYGAAWRGILFRRTIGELQDLIDRSHELYPQTGARWHEQKKTWTWPNGATLRFRYLELEKHRYRYQGHAYTWIGWDELTHWPTDASYRYLRSRLRSAYNVPTKRIRCTANPGGVGHHWVKAYFISPAPGGYTPVLDAVMKSHRMFIPSRLDNNAILVRNDPEYANRLSGLGSAALVKALRDGDWDVIDGAYFDCWSTKMVIRPFVIPRDWTRFRSGDWGSASPFSIGWFAIAQDDFSLPEGQVIPRGALVRYREWYGTKNPAESGGKGLKLTAEQVGEGIARLEAGDPKLTYGVLDPSAFKADGGPSIAERINEKLIAHRMIGFHPADNARVSEKGSKDKRGAMGGWDQMRSRMIGEAGRPMLYFFDTCVASIRTIPILQHDTAKPEDLDTNSEDHAADDVRYGCMSRPWIKSKPPAEKSKHDDYRTAAPPRSASIATL